MIQILKMCCNEAVGLTVSSCRSPDTLDGKTEQPALAVQVHIVKSKSKIILSRTGVSKLQPGGGHILPAIRCNLAHSSFKIFDIFIH